MEIQKNLILKKYKNYNLRCFRINISCITDPGKEHFAKYPDSQQARVLTTCFSISCFCRRQHAPVPAVPVSVVPFFRPTAVPGYPAASYH